ncbi:MAG: septum formation protein Maf [Proteobacteria bacterium]|nr:septum formation protein Maf [Pseudomonadota bacterium]NCA28491.1 septum formation protein Maf [Pseudomonadota bacterium]
MLVSCNYPIILASSSNIRNQILKSHNIDFKVVKPTYDEDSEKKLLKPMTPKNLALFLATQKALSVSKIHPNAVVIGSDQVCEFNQKDISKSHNLDEAIAQLKLFNGKTHYQNNAIVIVRDGKVIFRNFARASLTMRKLKTQQIIDYVNSDKPIGCAGSYKYESFGKHLFEKVRGDYFAILGLPIQPILNFLHSHEIINL